MASKRSLADSEFLSTFTDHFKDQLPDFYTFVKPTPVRDPALIAWSEELAHDLGLASPGSKEASLLSGNEQTPSMKPFAVRYGGHQFGNWAGQLGDGRAITLGELKDVHGQLQEIQLKGSGPTPYSRSGDGRAVLRSSIREFLASEAMHHLRVPTTRALSLVTTGDLVLRDPFYDGNPRYEIGAICTRVAPSFLRFGNFEILAASQQTEKMKQLKDWVVERHFKGMNEKQWFSSICEKTALMITEWLRVGFVHGVMNTDNMSLLGLTIDYGPYGWLEPFDPAWTPNTTDLPGRRYAFGRQPQIALWNLERFADALSLIMDESDLHEGLKQYGETFNKTFLEMMAKKLGLTQLESQEDVEWIQDLNSAMEALTADMTLFYRTLPKVSADTSLDEDLEHLKISFYQEPDAKTLAFFKNWLEQYKERIKKLNHAHDKNNDLRIEKMNLNNPKYILRNYMAFEASAAADKKDYSIMETLHRLLKHPYKDQPEFEKWSLKRPAWAKDLPGSSTLSCSS